MKNYLCFAVFIVFFAPIWAHTAPDQLQLAQQYFDKKAYKKCISLCDKILDKEPRSADAYYWKGRAYEEQKKPLEAANEYQAAILARPDFQAANESLVRVNSLLGKEPSQ